MHQCKFWQIINQTGWGRERREKCRKITRSPTGDELQFYSKIKKISQVTKNVDEGGTKKKNIIYWHVIFLFCVESIVCHSLHE